MQRAPVAGTAVDEAILRLRIEPLHRAERLVDAPMHRGHLAGDALRPLLVAGEIGVHVAVRAVDAECLAVAAVHDVEEIPGRSLLEQHEADVPEDAAGRLLLPPGDAGPQPRDESIVDLLARGRLIA